MTGFELRAIIGRDDFNSTALKAALSAYKGPRTKIHELLRKEVLIPLKKGFYVFGPKYRKGPLIRESIAMQLYGPSAISMEYALAHYGLIPERVHAVTCVTPKRDKKFNTAVGVFIFRRLAQPKYNVALKIADFGNEANVMIATPTKALCDQILLGCRARFNQPSEVNAYLSEDLRLDVSAFRRVMNKRELRSIVSAYGNHRVRALAEYLERPS